MFWQDLYGDMLSSNVSTCESIRNTYATSEWILVQHCLRRSPTFGCELSLK